MSGKRRDFLKAKSASGALLAAAIVAVIGLAGSSVWVGPAWVGFLLAGGIAVCGNRMMCWAVRVRPESVAGCLLRPAARMLAGFVALASIALQPADAGRELPLVVLLVYLTLLAADVAKAIFVPPIPQSTSVATS